MRCACRPATWALIAFAMITSTSCSDVTGSIAASPPPSLPPTEPAPPAPAPAFPPLSRPGVVYLGNDAIYDALVSFHQSKVASRYVLYDDSTFALQFSTLRFGFFEYTGRFTRADSRITFDWVGSSTAGPWGAIGTMRGDSLSVAYSLDMQMADFIDGVYVRVPEP